MGGRRTLALKRRSVNWSNTRDSANKLESFISGWYWIFGKIMDTWRGTCVMVVWVDFKRVAVDDACFNSPNQLNGSYCLLRRSPKFHLI